MTVESTTRSPLSVIRSWAVRRRGVPLDDAIERSVISSADRRKPSVRIVLALVQGLILVGLLIAGLGPLLWLAKASISATQDILTEPFALWPSGVVQWDNLWFAWTRGRIGFYLGNTVIVAAGSWIASLTVSITAAYVLSVLKPKWGPALSWAILITLFIPHVVSLVPLYLTILDMPGLGVSLLNTYWAVWLPAAANAFNVLVIKRFFDSLPHELFEAARIDGAGNVRILVSLVLPLSKPIIAVVSLLTIIASWKDFLWPLLVLQSPDLQPISVALPRIADLYELSIQMAALFLALIVPVLLFLIFQRQFLRGVSLSGGTKG